MPNQINDLLVSALPAMKVFALRLTRDHHNAEDLVQEVAVRALARANLYASGTNFRAWLFTIMRHHHIDQVRRHRSNIPLDDVPPISHPAILPKQDDDASLEELASAMRSLRKDQREVLMLVAAEGYSYEEAAAICGCPTGTIRSRLARARNKLKKSMLNGVN
ncbi:sigma-70 family RNA polymerase sigma factor [uncultured Ferrovibrio sp.]|jgi:RNA polymerase sigma-70 factor (ECF subfamily)|uniref:sigma-70 family RNA polymerase sigma factor n=1 Tax=uncultured Ferrovibrio sp. TaxID=1576913 RepID=UPI00260D6900|nr:sigma-70 family RNA polymerase sigma factor [uncultured Ferrovibrio sp.]